MASVDFRKELDCSICLSTYTDPVMLRCGHNYCRVCIDCVLDTQDKSGLYFCPQCREHFYKRPTLKRNITLGNIIEQLRTIPEAQKDTGNFCTNCIHSPVPAVKSCLHCEVFLCENHLRVHSKSEEHVLSDPSTSLEKRKCSVHKKILEYYCTEDAACICVSCSLVGEHRGHRVEMLDEASEKKKMKMRNVLQKLTTKRKVSEDKVQNLEGHWRKAQEKAAEEAERVTALCTDIRRRVDDLEKKVLSEISRQEKEESLSLSALIHQLEIKKDELSRKMRHIEELCNMTDPLTVLQEPDTGDLCDPEEEGGDENTGGHDKQLHDGDLAWIMGTFHAELSTIMSDLHTSLSRQPKQIKDFDNEQNPPVYSESLPVLTSKNGDNHGKVRIAGIRGIYVEDPADILLDVNTAANNIHISDDLKMATWTQTDEERKETAERFQDYNQVMSSRGFSSGRHYWDVEGSEVAEWMVGMCYPSIDRREDQSLVGYNKKSWCLQKENNYSVIHDSKEIRISDEISNKRVRICLDYEAGQLSFYELCDPIRHLHTFTATFSEPLHAVLCVGNGSLNILGEQQP
ncbi:E3 ubiquitin/ISG15 ligase TRIM25-like [Ranitomeya variabilis]|uniref:E3 ubiquitin/ISG15 ligase TRIM25-like n=1 Tax=Ranitomeya variabilis TaxID=490064 RepID=UPI0040560F09